MAYGVSLSVFAFVNAYYYNLFINISHTYFQTKMNAWEVKCESMN